MVGLKELATDQYDQMLEILSWIEDFPHQDILQMGS